MIIVGATRSYKSRDMFRLAEKNDGVVVTFDKERARTLHIDIKTFFGIKIRPAVFIDDFLNDDKRKELFKSGALKDGDIVYLEEAFETMYRVCQDMGLNLQGMTVGPGGNIPIVVKELSEEIIEKLIDVGYPETECRIQKEKVEEAL